MASVNLLDRRSEKEQWRKTTFAENFAELFFILQLHFVIFLYMVYLAKPLKLIKLSAAQCGYIHDLGSAWVTDIGCLFGENHFTPS